MGSIILSPPPLKGWYIIQSFRGKIFWLGCWKLKAAFPVNHFSGFLGRNIKNCPPSKLFLFTSLTETTQYTKNYRGKLNRHLLDKDRWLKGCGMGPWLVLVSRCFRENVVGTCKIGSFWCSLDNLLQTKVIVFFLFFFLEIKFQNGAHLKKKKLFLTYVLNFLITREKLQKFLQHISH